MSKETIQKRITELEMRQARFDVALSRVDVVSGSLATLFPTKDTIVLDTVRIRLEMRAKPKLGELSNKTGELIEKGQRLSRLEGILPKVEEFVGKGRLSVSELERVRETIELLNADVFPKKGVEKGKEKENKQGRAIGRRTKRTVAIVEERMTTASLIESTPEAMIRNLLVQAEGDFDVAADEIGQASRMIAAFYSGELIVPSEGDFLTARERGQDAQIEHAKKTLQGLIAFTITTRGVVRGKDRSLKYRLGLATNHLRFMLGISQGTELVNRAIDQLPNLERVLLMHSMSTNLKQELGYPDIDDCDEEQFAIYLRNSLYQNFGLGGKKEQPIKNPDELARLITVCADRIGKDFDAGKIIDRFFESDYAKDICMRLIEAARDLSVLDDLECIFQSSTRTSRFARRCREYLHGFEEWEMLPPWMNE